MNNRQAGRRNNNRGRNNGRQNGGNRGGDNGNRIDNRARGNAPQLLEKYRNLARDAQLAGDRVNTEYYLQFADHYFRVMADNRARQEEHQARFRRNDEPLDDMGDSAGEGAEQAASGSAGEGGESGYNREGRETSYNRDDRQSRNPRQQGRGRPRPVTDDDAATENDERSGEEAEVRRQPRRAEKIVVNRRVRSDVDSESGDQDVMERDTPSRDEVSGDVDFVEAKPAPRGRRPRAAAVSNDADEGAGLDLSALPPAIARVEAEEGDEEKPAPRRRVRRTKAEIEADAAAAAEAAAE